MQGGGEGVRKDVRNFLKLILEFVTLKEINNSSDKKYAIWYEMVVKCAVLIKLLLDFLYGTL